MTNRVRHRPHAKRSNPAVGVASAGFRLPDPKNRRPSTGAKGKQAAALGLRKHIAITLPQLSILKD